MKSLLLLRLTVATIAIATTTAACGDDDPFGAINPQVREGSARIWELAAEDLPSVFDFLAGRRLFAGSGDVGPALGDVTLSAGPGGELRLLAVSGLLRAETAHAVEIRDLGAVDFAALGEVPEEGYLAADDTLGAAVEVGHVYALRIVRSDLGANHAKLVVDGVGETGAPDRRFVDFRYAVQIQPGNPTFEEED